MSVTNVYYLAIAANRFGHTRIVGHLSLAEVYANEVLSDVTDGATVKAVSISVILLQTNREGYSSIAESQTTS